MALSILDGTQTATTLSTILSSGQHITAHTVVSLGTQAITDMRGAVSGSVVSISNFPPTQTIAGTVTANVFGKNVNAETFSQLPIIAFDENVQANPSAKVIPVQLTTDQGTIAGGNPLPISGTVTANVDSGSLITAFNDFGANYSQAIPVAIDQTGFGNVPISGTVTIGSALPAGTNRIGVVTIGAGTVTIGAGTAQIGSVTASISGGVINVNETLFAGGDGDLVTLGVQIGFFDSSLGEFVKVNSSTNRLPTNTFALQGTAVTTSNFTSTTASTVLASFNATREVLTIFNEGAGNLHVSVGATCTTAQYQVRLSSGDYYEVPNHQTTITHSAVFATAGTARVTQVS